MQHQRYTRTHQDQSVLSAWQEQLAAAAQNPKLMQRLLSREPELLPRFEEHYKRLRALPRRMRRAMQRRWKKSLAALALLLALGVTPAHGATITVTAPSPHINADGKCSLIEAIVNANDDAKTHADCAAGSGADIIVLPPGSTQTFASYDNSTYGPTGLPVITSEITIEGNGSTIERDSGAAEFRIFAVGSSGDLTLQQTTVSGGIASGEFPYYSDFGGGVFNSGTLTLSDSTISGNEAEEYGGGLYNGTFATITVTNSTISGNSASDFGGGVWNFDTLTLSRTLVSGNTASTGPEILSYSGTVNADNFNLFGHSGNSGVVGFSPGATDIVPTEPLSSILDPTLADNGGSTQTHAPVPGSPAIDASPDDEDCQSTDQRGVARPQGRHVTSVHLSSGQMLLCHSAEGLLLQ